MPDPSIEAPVVTIEGREVTLQPCTSLFSMASRCKQLAIPAEEWGGEEHALASAYGAAALRMCWPRNSKWPTKVRPPAWLPGQRVAVYGARIWEDLVSALGDRVDRVELQAICSAAANYALECGMSNEELQAARNFSQGQEE